jgi:hypothetical protein
MKTTRQAKCEGTLPEVNLIAVVRDQLRMLTKDADRGAARWRGHGG